MSFMVTVQDLGMMEDSYDAVSPNLVIWCIGEAGTMRQFIENWMFVSHWQLASLKCRRSDRREVNTRTPRLEIVRTGPYGMLETLQCVCVCVGMGVCVCTHGLSIAGC
jgi:hypothetical protein